MILWLWLHCSGTARVEAVTTPSWAACDGWIWCFSLKICFRSRSLMTVLLVSYKCVQSSLTHDPTVSLYPCKSGLRNSFVEVCLPAFPPVLFSSGEHAARAGWALIRYCMGWWGSSSLGKNTQQKKRQSNAKNHRFIFFFRWEENVLLQSQFTNRG